MGQVWVQMGLLGPWIFCTCSVGFFVGGDSPWLMGSSSISRSPRAEILGMVVVAYPPIGVGRPVE
jgi:hypothetical protein